MKSKRVLTILLSMAIMLTFMPTMAFAAIVPGSVDHVWEYNEAKSIPETCSSEGLAVYTCTGNEELGLACEALKAEFRDPKGYHTAKANPTQMSKDDLIKRLASDWGLDAAAVDKLYKDNEGDCYAFVYECKECGKVPMKNGNIDTDFVKWQGHKKPAGTPACAMSYVCEFCGQTVATGVTEDSGLHQYNHGNSWWSNWDYAKQYVCGDADAHYGYAVQQRTCTVCGHVQTRQRWEGNGQPKHGELEEYVKPGDEPTCEATGTKSQRCKDCGMDVPFADPSKAVIPALGHDMATFTYDATCTTDAYTYNRCSRCTLKNNYVTIPNSRLGHNYKVEVIFEPNCDAVGITRISCTNPGCGYSEFANTSSHIRYVGSNGDVHMQKQNGDKIYFVGRDNEYLRTTSFPNQILDGAIELADWTAKTHDWGQFEDMQVADCTHGAMQAAKCKVCGHYDAHTAIETGEPVGHKFVTKTQNPTCGAKGFTYEICSVCGAYGTAKAFGNPVVGYGTDCDMEHGEWLKVKDATPFEKGLEKLVCPVCGDDGHLYLEGGAVKVANVKYNVIPKTAIAAPKVKAGKKKATVTVKAVPGAVKYQIKVNGKVKVKNAKVGKNVVRKLKGGKKAKFQIVAINDKGVKVTSKAKSVKIKK